MTEFVEPVFVSTIAFQATLVKSEVEQYAKKNNISFQEATQVLGREYVMKYANYSQVWIDGVSTKLEFVDF